MGGIDIHHNRDNWQPDSHGPMGAASNTGGIEHPEIKKQNPIGFIWVTKEEQNEGSASSTS